MIVGTSPHNQHRKKGSLMAQSSIHIDKGGAGYFKHNDRSQKTVNAIFDDEKNEIWQSAEEAFEMYRSELAARTEAYQKRTGQKIQKKAVTHLSAIVNLEQHHTLDDLEKLKMYLEETLDTKIVQLAIHRDEGHIDDDGNPVKNYHAHIEFMGLDSEGRSVRKKLTKGYLSKLQDKTAEILGMERGRNYAREQAPRPKRLDTYEYKASAKQKQEERKKAKQEAEQKAQAKIKDIQEESKRLREKLKAEEAKRADYAELEALVKDLKAKAKEKDLTIEEMQERIEAFEAEKATQDTTIEEKDAQIAKLEADNEDLEAKVKELEEDKVGMGDLVTHFHDKSKELETENKKLKEEVSKLKAIIDTLKAGATKVVDAVKEAVTKKTDEYDDPNGIFTREEMKDMWHFSNGKKVDEEVFKFKYENAMQRKMNTQAKGMKLKR